MTSEFGGTVQPTTNGNLNRPWRAAPMEGQRVRQDLATEQQQQAHSPGEQLRAGQSLLHPMELQRPDLAERLGMCPHTHTRPHAHTCTHTHTLTHTHTHAHSHAHTGTRTCTHTHMHSHTHTYAHTRTHMCTHTHTHTRVVPQLRPGHTDLEAARAGARGLASGGLMSSGKKGLPGALPVEGRRGCPLPRHWQDPRALA